MKVIIVQVLDDAKKDEAFEIVVDALGSKEILAMSFECESTTEAATRLAELARKDPPPVTEHKYRGDDEMYGCF